jgi:Zn-dependent alcohol dehydrogenase
MSQQVRGVVARVKGEPVGIETIVIPDPGPGEAVVRIRTCGVRIFVSLGMTVSAMVTSVVAVRKKVCRSAHRSRPR